MFRSAPSMPLSKALFPSVSPAAKLISGEPHVSPGLQEDPTGSMGDSTSPWSSAYDFSNNSYDDQGFQLPLNLYSCIASDEFQSTAQGHSGSETMWTTHQPMSYSSLDADSSCPRSYPTLDVEAIAAAFPPSYFHVDPQNFQTASESSDQQHPAHILRADTDSLLGSNYCLGNDVTSNTHPAPSQGLSTQHTEITADSNLTPLYENDHENVDDPIEDLHSDDTKMSDQPYAILIWHALRAAPNHTMVLKDIYHWFTQHTDKGKDKSKDNAIGWQNSVRHNLSMNAAFVKIPQLPGEESKKGCTWQLAPQFLDVPPKSTTRYRNKDPNKRTPKSLNPAPLRQVSGAKGGQAAKKSATLRRSQRVRLTRDKQDLYTPTRTAPYPKSIPRSSSRLCTVSPLSTGPDNVMAHSPCFSDDVMPPLYPLHTPRLNAGAPRPAPPAPFPPSSASPDPFGPPTGLKQEPLLDMSNMYDAADYIGLMPLDPSKPLFYDSGSDFGDEPLTPSDFGAPEFGPRGFY